MPEPLTTCTALSRGCHGCLAAGAVLLMFVLAASPSGADDCDDWTTASFFKLSTVSDVRACLAAGADPMAQGDAGFTPLHFAAALPDGRRIVEALLDAGADPMARAESGLTPLHAAAMLLGDPGGMALLLDVGVDPNVPAVQGITPLHVIGLGAEAVFSLHGMVWDRLPDWMADHLSDWMAPDSHAAAIVALLVEAGADPMAREDRNGFTPLHSVSIYWD